MQILVNCRSFEFSENSSAHSPRIWAKSAPPGNRPSSLLLACPQCGGLKPRGHGAGHAVSAADGVLAERRSGVAAERRIAAGAEGRMSAPATPCRRRRAAVADMQQFCGAAARRLRGRIAGGGRARPPCAGRRQDALRIPQRASRSARHRRVDEDRGRQGGAAAAGAAIAAHPHAGRSGAGLAAVRSRIVRRAAIVPPEARSADLRSPTSHGSRSPV